MTDEELVAAYEAAVAVHEVAFRAWLDEDSDEKKAAWRRAARARRAAFAALPQRELDAQAERRRESNRRYHAEVRKPRRQARRGR